MNKVFIFVLGAAVGSLVTWKFVEEKYRRIADEEIESVKETFKNRESKIAEDEKQAEELGVKSPSKEFYSQLKENTDKLTNNLSEKYKDIIATSGYNSTDIQKNTNIKDYEYTDVDGEGQIIEIVPSDYPEPYVIAPEEFGELEDFKTKSFIYYEDKVVATADDRIVDDVEVLIGDALDHFGDYEDDAVHVRNEKEKTDYEILRSEKYYTDLPSVNIANFDEEDK